MTAEQKANELIEKFKPHADWNNEYGSAEERQTLNTLKNVLKFV